MRMLGQSAIEESTSGNARGGTSALLRAVTSVLMVKAYHPGALLLLTLALAALPSHLSAADSAAHDHFEKRIRPLLVERCHKCHAGEKVKGNLHLDSARGLRQGGETGAVVVPGKPDESRLIQAVRHE